MSASLWVFVTDAETWRLFLASPIVDSSGTRKAYRRVQQILSRSAEVRAIIQLQDITVVGVSDPLIATLRSALKTGAGISGIKFSRGMINGMWIEDAFFYRMI